MASKAPTHSTDSDGKSSAYSVPHKASSPSMTAARAPTVKGAAVTTSYKGAKSFNHRSSARSNFPYGGDSQSSQDLRNRQGTRVKPVPNASFDSENVKTLSGTRQTGLISFDHVPHASLASRWRLPVKGTKSADFGPCRKRIAFC